MAIVPQWLEQALVHHERLVALVVSHLRRFGYDVRINEVYKGATIVSRYGAPARGYSTIQIELNRALYLDEVQVEPTPGFAKLKRAPESLMATLAAEVKRQHPRLAAGASPDADYVAWCALSLASGRIPAERRYKLLHTPSTRPSMGWKLAL